jgi:hypothetical protein
VHTLFGHQMGARKGYNPQHKGEEELPAYVQRKAGVFSGSLTHQNRSQSSVAWIARREGN